jgi:MFS family permease
MRPGGLLRQRNFRLLWVGETVSGAGNALALVVVPLLAVTVLRASTFAVAALTAAAYLPWLVIGLPAGAWVDRWPARPLMIACDVISALLYASLPVAAWLGVLATGQVVIVALLAGAANVFFTTAYQVCLPALVTPAELVEGNARLQGGAAAAAIGGRGVAGLIAQAIGPAAALGVNAASFVASALCLLRIRPAAPDPSTAPDLDPEGLQDPASPEALASPAGRRTSSIRAEAWQGICFVARDPYLRPMTLYAAVANLAYTGNLALVVVFLVRVVGLGSAAVGLLLAAGGVGGVLGALGAPRLTRRFGTARTLLLASLGAGLAGLLIPLTGPGPRLACYAAGAALIAGGISVGNVIAGSFRQEYCPPAMLGRASASMRFLAYGMIPFGALLAGALGTALGVRNALWIVQAIFAASALFLLTPRIRTARQLPRRPSAADLSGLGQDADHLGDCLFRVRSGRAHGDLLAAGRAEPHDGEHALGVGPARAHGQLDGRCELRRRYGQRAGRPGMQVTRQRDRCLIAFWHDVPPRPRSARP